MQAHSPYGMSQAARYMACPGSVALAMRAPPERPSPYAEEGTFAHAVAAHVLERGGDSASSLVGTEFTFMDHGVEKRGIVTEEMANAVNVYIETVWEIAASDPASEMEIEQRVSLPLDAAEDGEVFSTLDCVIYLPASRKLVVLDYKHGAGILVDAAGNIQCKGYGLMAMHRHPEWAVSEIELIIVQPRAFDATENRGVKRWSLPMVETIEFPYELNEAVALSKSPDAPLAAGDHCQFCPASTICTVREQEFVKACNADLAGVSLPEVADVVTSWGTNEINYDHMARIVEAYDRLGAWVNDLRKAMDEHLLAGGTIEGWKVVEEVSRRKWVSGEEEITGYLGLVYGIPDELIRPRKLETITEVKRLLKSFVPKDQYAEAEKDLTLRFTIKESKGLTTAPASDKRAGVSPVAAEFGSVMLGTE